MTTTPQSTIIKLAERTTYINVDFVGWMNIIGDTRMMFHFFDGTEMTVEYSSVQVMYDDMRKFIHSKENYDCSGTTATTKD